ncbi:hypothetical protein [Enterococcus sp. DIV0086]|uniref:hypothetical protein n=1 Tax=Enterococcus sp. DIV0086 TaxID=2774655 RepID=UPI003D2A8128
MAKVYKTVRLAYETKIWIDKLIVYRERQLQVEIKNGLIKKLEEEIQSQFNELVNGVSLNLVLKVSSGSVLEQAYRYCEKQNLSNEEWSKIEKRMNHAVKENDFKTETTVTPKFYLDEDILDGLEHYRYRFKIDEPGKRLPLLSYIIKLVVFAFYDSLIQTGDI